MQDDVKMALLQVYVLNRHLNLIMPDYIALFGHISR